MSALLPFAYNTVATPRRNCICLFVSFHRIVEARWKLGFDLTQEYSIKVGEQLFNKTFEKDLIKFPIPYVGFKLPRALGKVLNWLLPDGYEVRPEAGLFLVSSTSLMPK